MMKTSHLPHFSRRQRGVTLVELMVGMVIGLLAVLVMTQVGAVFEGHKRSTTTGSDAQVNAALSLYTLQRDIRMAGYGLTSASRALGCQIKGQRNGTPTPPLLNMVLAPVVITDGASGAPDQIEVMMSASPNFSLPVEVTSDHLRSENEFRVQANIGNSIGDLMLAVPDPVSATSWCSIFNISADPATTGDVIRHEPGPNGPWNGNNATVFPGATDDAVSFPARSYVVNLGRFTQRTYSVSANHTLQVQAYATDAVASAREDLFPNVVNLQAVYGKDTNNDLVADQWNVTPPADPSQWGQVVAVRLAVITRSEQYEKDAVTTSAPSWKPDGVTSVNVSVSSLPDWQHYRYKVYEVVVPLRNVLWHAR